ncbi:PR domain zinc finger protein 13-like [Diadema setosum]|uniref:PR domain zinc finger protein 13-like n=1 Tax=Diadema setosum TaxID=31175 RepID=UPI003B3AA7B9
MLSAPEQLAPTNPTTGRSAGRSRPSLEPWDARQSGAVGQPSVAVGVWTSSEIPPDVIIGPHDDSVLKFGDNILEDSIHPIMIEVRVEYGRLVSANDANAIGWIQNIAAARHDHEQNLTAERRPDGLVAFRTTRHVLKGEELRVWYAPALARKLGVPAHVGSYEDEDGFFACPLCARKFRYPNALKSHLKSCRASSHCNTVTVRPIYRHDREQPDAGEPTRLGSAFRRVTPRSVTESTSLSRSSGDDGEGSVSWADHQRPLSGNNAFVSGSRDVGSTSAFKPHTKTNAVSSGAREKTGFRAFRKTHSPSTTRSSDDSVMSTVSSSESTRKDSGVLFSVDKMLNKSAGVHGEGQSTSGEAMKSPTGLDKNANPFDPLAYKSQLSIPATVAQYQPLDPYAHIPIRCFQPMLPSIVRYGSILPPVHHRELFNGVSHPYFPYKVPIPTPFKFVHPPHPLPPPNELEMPKFAGLERTHLPLQGSSPSFQVGETQYSYLQDSGRKNKRGHLCIYCGKLYSRKYGLKIHLRTHTGYKPLKCKVCLRPFGDPSNLNKHIRLHAEGETPYRCEYCGKVLVRRRDLDRHIRSRHPSEAAKREEKQRQEAEGKEAENANSRPSSATEEEEDEEDEGLHDDAEMSPLSSPDASKHLESSRPNDCIDVQSAS